MGGSVVIAIGGNSLIRDASHQSVRDQYEAAGKTSRRIASLATAGWRVAITHGNGPQVGFILRRSELAAHELHELPLDVCGADTQGAIGYALQQHLQNDFRVRGIAKQAATLVTQCEVDPYDPAFKNPSKPIGSYMTESEARRRELEEGWSVMEDAGRGWRRVVPSPEPKRIVELDAIVALLDSGFVVISTGGGGIPVVRYERGDLQGVPAVIDKDLASSLMANGIGADTFLISTGVERVALRWGRPDQEWVDRLTASEARRYLDEGGHFARGSMAPKIEAAARFVEGGGHRAIISDPDHLEEAMDGEAGTTIVPG